MALGAEVGVRRDCWDWHCRFRRTDMRGYFLEAMREMALETEVGLLGAKWKRALESAQERRAVLPPLVFFSPRDS